MVLNKMIKILGYVLSHLLVALELYLTSFLLVSPILSIVFGVLDVVDKVPSFIQGKYLLLWLGVSAVVWLGLIVYVEIKTYRLTKQQKQEE